MDKKRFQKWWASFSEIFSFQNDESKGRTLILSSNLLVSFYNVFISGIFYTGFLTMYDMSITDAGIISFIPLISNVFSLFSNKIMGRVRRPKKVLLCAKMYFYAMYILVATAMPNFVKDPDARLVCFVVIMFFGYAVYAPFSPGFTTWFYNFYPQDNDKRAHYLALSQTFSSIVSSVILMVSSFIADALSGSDYQNQFIIFFRYFAFFFVLVEVFLQSKVKEYPSPDRADLKLRQVFTFPFQHKKFMACMLFMFVYSFVGNLNGSLWQYHILNHLHFSYTLINGLTVIYTLMLICLSPLWQKVLRRYSWIKTFGIALLLFAPTELAMFFIAEGSGGMYVSLVIVQHVMNVGLNLSYANILYMNLPAENSTTCIVFNTIGCNVCALLGTMVATWISAITGDNTMPFMGMDLYSVQFAPLLRGVLMLLLGIFLINKWRIFTRDVDIAEIEQRKFVRDKFKHQRRGLWFRR